MIPLLMLPIISHDSHNTKWIQYHQYKMQLILHDINSLATGNEILDM